MVEKMPLDKSKVGLTSPVSPQEDLRQNSNQTSYLGKYSLNLGIIKQKKIIRE